MAPRAWEPMWPNWRPRVSNRLLWSWGVKARWSCWMMQTWTRQYRPQPWAPFSSRARPAWPPAASIYSGVSPMNLPTSLSRLRHRRVWAIYAAWKRSWVRSSASVSASAYAAISAMRKVKGLRCWPAVIGKAIAASLPSCPVSPKRWRSAAMKPLARLLPSMFSTPLTRPWSGPTIPSTV